MFDGELAAALRGGGDGSREAHGAAGPKIGRQDERHPSILDPQLGDPAPDVGFKQEPAIAQQHVAAVSMPHRKRPQGSHDHVQREVPPVVHEAPSLPGVEIDAGAHLQERQQRRPAVERVGVGLVRSLAGLGVEVFRGETVAPRCFEQLPALRDQGGGFGIEAGALQPEPYEPVEDRPDAATPIDVVAIGAVAAAHRGEHVAAAEHARTAQMPDERLGLRLIGGPDQQRIEARRRKACHEVAVPKPVCENAPGVIPEMARDAAAVVGGARTMGLRLRFAPELGGD